jgi:single-strand selective monofunctional uracil DNA glycosylase
VSEVSEIAGDLSKRIDGLSFSEPTTHVYNPLVYAWDAHVEYLERYAAGTRNIMFLGMNPGPFGMAQTGVPFGDPGVVRDVLKIRSPIAQPKRPHPKRPVLGLESTRGEVSGRRVWSWVQASWGGVERFAERAVIVNYCPLCFMEASGKNRTPDKLKKPERDALYAACDEALLRRVEYHQPEWVIGFGAFAEKRARSIITTPNVKIGRVLHPSPASPAANRGWAPQANQQLSDLGIEQG